MLNQNPSLHNQVHMGTLVVNRGKNHTVYVSELLNSYPSVTKKKYYYKIIINYKYVFIELETWFYDGNMTHDSITKFKYGTLLWNFYNFLQ